MEVWQAVVLGLVEGITEYLPVSSTGHLILAAGLLGLDDTPQAKAAVDDFTIVIQGGAILAVLGVYWPSVVRMVKGVFGRDGEGFALLVNLVIAFLPAAVLGLLIKDVIKAHLFSAAPVILALALGGVYMMAVEWWRKGRFGLPEMAREDDVMRVTPRQALTIGLFQCVAMWPGTSRSMMTITGGLFAGLSPRAAAEFSFLLGLPTLVAATLLSLWSNVSASMEPGGPPNIVQTFGWIPILVGIAVATVSAAGAVKWLVGFLNRRGLMLFAWYRLVLAFVLLALTTTGVVQIGTKFESPKPDPTHVPPVQVEGGR